VARWRRPGADRTAIAFGAVTAALLLADGLWANGAGTHPFIGFLPALLAVLVADVLIADDRSVPLAIVRLGVIYALLSQAPLYAAQFGGSVIGDGAHPLLEIVAAGFALAAVYRARAAGRAVTG
jgi:hypothetical protein